MHMGLPKTMIKQLRFVSFFLCFILLSSLAVFAQSVDVIEDEVDIQLNQGETKSFTVDIQNTGTARIVLSFAHNIDLIDNEGDEITITFPQGLEIDPNNTTQASIQLDADTNIDFGRYSGTITVTDTVTNESDTFRLTIQVDPAICDFGVTGGDLEIDIEDPDDGDEFAPGDNIRIKVEVKNNGNDDIRTQLEAFLFTEDDNIADIASDTQNIEEGDDEEFIMNLKMPTSNNELDEDEKLQLFVKAFDDENEQLNCVQESIEVELELKAKDVRIDEGRTKFLPPVTACGEITSLAVGVINVGDKDISGQVTIENNQLNIRRTSDTFEIEEFASDDANEALKRFEIRIPDTAEPGEYTFNIKSTFGGKTDTMLLPLEIVNCDLAPLAGIRTGEIPTADIIVLNQVIASAQGNDETVHVKITNNLPSQQIFFINIKDVTEFSQLSSKSIALAPFQTTNVFLPLEIRNDVDDGKYTAVVEVTDGRKTVASETITITVDALVAQVTEETSGIISAVPLSIWILLNIILIVLFIMAYKVLKVEIKKYRS